MAFAGINSTANRGDDATKAKIISVSATKVKVALMSGANENSNGITIFADYTKAASVDSGMVLTASFLFPGIHATNEWPIDSSSSTTPAAATKTLTASGRLLWPIAAPALSPGYLVLTLSPVSGAFQTDTVVTIDAIRDTISGR